MQTSCVRKQEFLSKDSYQCNDAPCEAGTSFYMTKTRYKTLLQFYIPDKQVILIFVFRIYDSPILPPIADSIDVYATHYQ